MTKTALLKRLRELYVNRQPLKLSAARCRHHAGLSLRVSKAGREDSALT